MRANFLLRVVIALGLGLAPIYAIAAERFEFDAPLFESSASGYAGWENLAANFARGSAAKTVRISGTLNFPEGAQGPVPAAIVAHTSGGPGPDGRLVESNFNKFGYATVNYDSYRPRGYVDNNGSGGGGPKLEMHQVVDSYIVLKLLAANPRIDPKRIVLVGMSAGGNAAMLATSTWIRNRYAGADGPRFAALVAYYPGGYFLPVASDVSSETPLLIVPAEKDDFMRWSRTKVWVDYVQRENPAANIDVAVVPGALHSFFNSSSQGSYQSSMPSPVCPYLLASAETGASISLHLDGTVSSNPWDRGCFKRGATTGYSGAASVFALEKTFDFLKRVAGRT